MTIQESMQQIGKQARAASHAMLRANDQQKALALEAMAQALSMQRSALQAANKIDLEAGRAKQLTAPLRPLDPIRPQHRHDDRWLASNSRHVRSDR